MQVWKENNPDIRVPDLEVLESLLTDFRIWADGLCINQKDLMERSAQVCRMRDIYYNASCVFGNVMATPAYPPAQMVRTFQGFEQLARNLAQFRRDKELDSLEWLLLQYLFTCMDKMVDEL